MKAFTDISQSKKLAEILPIESADMYYCYGMNIHTKGWSFDSTPTIIDNSNQIDVHTDMPCWSLAALLDVVSEEVSLNSFKDGNWNAMVQQNGKMIYGDTDNPVDACYEMILKLHELKML